MITISFYSYKGGVGRSLTLTNLGVYLAQFGASVIMVDFDLEAPGLQYKIRPGSPPIEVRTRGLAGLLADADVGAWPPNKLAELVVDLTEYIESSSTSDQELFEQSTGRLLLVPAGNPQEPEYWDDLANIDWPALFTGPERPGVAALAALRQHLIDEFEPDVMLIDSRTGITPSGGVSTTLLPDVVVTLFLDNPEHVDGTRMVISAIAGDDSRDAGEPTVVPVLSRYTGRHLVDTAGDVEERHRGLVRGPGREAVRMDEDIPTEEMWQALVEGLDPHAKERVAEPLVLHADLELQRRERLSFGPYAPEQGGALLDDYLRLFANLVPQEMVTRYLSGVRSRVRAIILDKPDDAVRTLENLAALVGDEGVFVDLIRIHVLRRDIRSVVAAADRLYRIHETIVVEPDLSRALREILSGRVRVADASMLDPEFLEAYWRRADPTDVAWGAGVARAFAERTLFEEAEELSEEIAREAEDPSSLARIIEVLAAGGAGSERLAVELAHRYLSVGQTSSEFVKAAAMAWSYRPDTDLAMELPETSAFNAVPDHLAVDILQAAGREEEAAELLVQTLATAEPHDYRSVERFAEAWNSLASRNPGLRDELAERNPYIIEHLEEFSTERARRPRRFTR